MPELPKWKDTWLNAFKPVVGLTVVVLVGLSTRHSIADHYIVPSGSMEDTIQVGDRILVDKLSLGLRFPFTELEVIAGRSPQRGEVVVFDSPETGERLLKRVAAVGGDRVTLRDGWLTVNGETLREHGPLDVEAFDEHLARLNLSRGGGPDIAELLVPEGQVLVLGDARGNSHDSRYFGLIPEDAIYGRALGVFYRAGEGVVWYDL